METEKYQKELFDGFEPQRKAANKFGGIFPRADFAVTLTPDKIVFTAIGIIMLMVVFFALGVEKGRSAAYDKLTQTQMAVKKIAAVPAVPVKAVSVKMAVAPAVAAKNVPAANTTQKINAPATAVKAQPVPDKTKPYTVVAATYTHEDLAMKEVGKLKTAGFEAFVYYGEPYYLACVGYFQNKESAQKILTNVRQMHRDAYVRMR